MPKVPDPELIVEPRAKLLYAYPFFGSLALYLVPVETEAIPTAGVDGRHLFWNRKFMEGCSEKERQGILAHEVLHCALGHVFHWRQGNRNDTLFNIAGDYVINQMLKDEGLQLPEGCLYEEKYKNMSTEEVYSELPKPKPNCKTCGGTGCVPNDQQQQGGGGSGDQEQEKDDKGQSGGKKKEKADDGEEQDQGGGGGKEGGEPQGMKPCPDCGGTPCGGIGLDILPADSGTTEEEQKLAREWEERLVSSAQIAKQRGHLPAGIERMLDELLNPKLPWYVLLSQLISEVVRDDYDMMVYDRRLIDLGIYLPDIYNEEVYAAVAVDTSGSITEEELCSFLSETWAILHSRNVSRIRLMSCDADVHFDKTFMPQDPVPRSVPGGGGTRFEPVFERLYESQDRPACLIYFTDTFGSYPEEAPPYPVFWVTKTPLDRISEPPFGKVLHFE